MEYLLGADTGAPGQSGADPLGVVTLPPDSVSGGARPRRLLCTTAPGPIGGPPRPPMSHHPAEMCSTAPGLIGGPPLHPQSGQTTAPRPMLCTTAPGLIGGPPRPSLQQAAETHSSLFSNPPNQPNT